MEKQQAEGFASLETGSPFASPENTPPTFSIEGDVMKGIFSHIHDEGQVSSPLSFTPRWNLGPIKHSQELELTELPSPNTHNPSESLRKFQDLNPFFEDREKECLDYQAMTFTPNREKSLSANCPGDAAQKKHLFSSSKDSCYDKSLSRRSTRHSVKKSLGTVRIDLGDVATKILETRQNLDWINDMVRGNLESLKSDSIPSGNSNFRKNNRMISNSQSVKTPPTTLEASVGEMDHLKFQHQSSRGSMRKFKDMSHSVTSPIENISDDLIFKEQSFKSKSLTAQNTKSSDRKIVCNCKRTKCLKLYCECFSRALFCNGCHCNNCRNVEEHKEERDLAIQSTRAKNVNAFKPRIPGQNGTRPTTLNFSSGHTFGCKCKKSECLKRYCECYQAGIYCGSACKCMDCFNFVGSQALMDKRKLMKGRVEDQVAKDTAKVNNAEAINSEVTYNPSLSRRHLLDESDERSKKSISLIPQEIDPTISSFPASRRSIRMPILNDSLPSNQCRRTLRKRSIVAYMEDDEPIPVHSSSFFSNVSKHPCAGNDNSSNTGDNIVSPSKDNYEVKNSIKDLISDNRST